MPESVKLREPGKELIEFVRLLEQHHAGNITQALALAWAQQPSKTKPAHRGPPAEFGTRIRTLSQRHGSGHADSFSGSVTLPTEAGSTLSVFGGRDPQLTSRRSPDAPSLPVRQAAPVDLLLSIRIIERHRPTPRRSAQPPVARRRSEGGRMDGPRRQVREDSPRAWASLSEP